MWTIFNGIKERGRYMWLDVVLWQASLGPGSSGPYQDPWEGVHTVQIELPIEGAHA
jgi:hypothetical protein